MKWRGYDHNGECLDCDEHADAHTKECPYWKYLEYLLKECYSRIPPSRLGKTIMVDYDPAGSTYEFTEFEWSKRVREILGIKYEPDGV